MRKLSVFFATLVIAAGVASAAPDGKVLYLYDEDNAQSGPYVEHYETAFAAEGIPYDKVTAAALPSVDLSRYQYLVIHGMVMAFNTKSPIRDWLSKGPDLRGKKVSLLVTANRWFLPNLFGQLQDLLKKDKADLVDAVSMATKNTDDAAEAAAVKDQLARLKTFF